MEKESPDAYAHMVRTESSITQNSLIPEDIQLFITTSRNKEGINIDNTDIEHLYVESHIHSDIIQMAGRIRSGVKNMYIVLNSKNHHLKEWKELPLFCSTVLTSGINTGDSLFDGCNDFLEKLCNHHKVEYLFNLNREAETTAYAKGNSQIADYIDYVHDTFPYVRYSYQDNVFRFYHLRHDSYMYQQKNLMQFNKAIEQPLRLSALLKQWFPTTKVHPYVSTAVLSSEAQNKAAVSYLQCQGVMDPTTRFTAEQHAQMLGELNKIYGTELTSLNTLLGRCVPIELKRVSNDAANPSYNLYRPVKRIRKAS